MSEAVEVVADDRERKSGVVEELERLGVRVRVERLDVADYMVGRSYGVERKTPHDLINSIIDRRLFEQARYMSRAFERSVVVVEGDLGAALAVRDVRAAQVYGALAALVDMGLSVMFTRSYVETALLIYSLWRRAAAGGRERYLPPVKLRVVKYNKGVAVAQLNLVASLPGINVELAHRILSHFKTPRRFFKASSAELRRVPGLGDKRVRKIIEVLDTVYDSSISPEARPSS